MEKTASFHGYNNFSSCISVDNDEDKTVYKRIINIMSHGNYSLFDPLDMVGDNKKDFKKILDTFLKEYNFNKSLLESNNEQEANNE